MVGDPVGQGDGGDGAGCGAEEDPEGDAVDDAAGHVGGRRGWWWWSMRRGWLLSFACKRRVPGCQSLIRLLGGGGCGGGGVAFGKLRYTKLERLTACPAAQPIHVLHSSFTNL